MKNKTVYRLLVLCLLLNTLLTYYAYTHKSIELSILTSFCTGITFTVLIYQITIFYKFNKR